MPENKYSYYGTPGEEEGIFGSNENTIMGSCGGCGGADEKPTGGIFEHIEYK